ncbi:hypothetical protein [Rhodopila sp.]|uniref:hypothetical protein n=1 Tax=Rhodopila sp. TaxID=2480087 RepID=UPI003D13F54A
MKVVMGNTAMAATLITNCVVTIMNDSGFTVTDAIQDQINTVAMTVVGLAITAFIQWAHDHMRTQKDKTIVSLVASNQKLAETPAVQRAK